MAKPITKLVSLGSLKRPLYKGHAPILPLVISVAYKIWAKSDGSADYHDVVSEALLGLVKASKRYSKARNVKFSTFAFRRIVGGAQDQVRRERKYTGRFTVVDPSWIDIVTVSDGIQSHILRKELLAQVHEVLEREMPGTEAQVLIMFYLKEMSEEDIAKELQCSSRAVRRSKQAALELARDRMKKRGHHGIA